MRFVSYRRVSTDKQGKSGLGLEAQSTAISNYLATQNGSELVCEYVEVESGCVDDRPELTKALAHARAISGRVVVAKLDRAGRSVGLLNTLIDSGLCVCADMPDCDPAMLKMFAIFSELERKKISLRTKEALAASKARGKLLGGFRGRAPTASDRAASAAARRAAAKARAADVLPLVRQLQDGGSRTLREIGAGLEKAGVLTPRGCSTWHPAAVSAVLKLAA